MRVFIKGIVTYHHFDALRALTFELDQPVLLLKNRKSRLKWLSPDENKKSSDQKSVFNISLQK